MSKVEVINPTIADGKFNRSLMDLKIKRVAAYARVSTDSDEQANSFENQVDEWTKRIAANPEYTLVKIYADEGISGTQIKGRDGFQELIRDCRAGKIDLILCKSISRFARNVLESIQTVRELKTLGVGVIFETDGVNSLDPNSELLFTIIATIAQEESRHISENVTWSFQKKMNDGHPILCAPRFLGYVVSQDKTHLEIVPEHVPIIQLIFNMYDSGQGPAEIKRALKERGYKSPTGREDWHSSTITSILRNEKYVGDLLLQKTYTVDYLTHKSKENKGQRKMYFVKDAHEAIIPRDQWDRVQRRLNYQSKKARGSDMDISRYNTKHVLSGMLICYQCGHSYKRRKWTAGYKKGCAKIAFQCLGYVEPDIYGHKPTRCINKPIGEVLLLKMCAEVINKVFLSSTNIFEKLKELIKSALVSTSIETKIIEKRERKDVLTRLIDETFQEKLRFENFEMRDKFEKRYNDLVDEYQLLTIQIKELEDKENNNNDLLARLDEMMRILDHKEITWDMITKDMLDAFMYRIIVCDSSHVVVTINATNTLSLEQLREQRKEVVERQAILERVLIATDPIRKKKLHYKVVLV